MHGPAGALHYNLPFPLGHESAGSVGALGPGTTGLSEGDRVLVYARWRCGDCWHCLRGWRTSASAARRSWAARVAVWGRDGWLADYMVVPSVRYLVAIDDLDPAAPLTNAGLTPYHAIKRSLPRLRPNGCAVVIGVGGLGPVAVQVLERAELRPSRRGRRPRRGSAAGARCWHARCGIRTGPHAGGFTDGDRRRRCHARPGLVASDATLVLAAGVVAQGGDISFVGRRAARCRSPLASCRSSPR